MRRRDRVRASEPAGGDGAQVSAVEVEQAQPGALRMAIAGEDDNLVAMDGEVDDRPLLLLPLVVRLRFDRLDLRDELQLRAWQGG